MRAGGGRAYKILQGEILWMLIFPPMALVCRRWIIFHQHTMSVNLKNRIEKILNKLRPSINFHGGDVELINIQDGVVKLKVSGSCVGCPMASLTFGAGVGEAIKKIKGVKKVIYQD